MTDAPSLLTKVFAWLARIEPARREILLASTFLVFLTGIGTTGYVFLEEWSWLDGLYMTFITLTTIGFSEVSKMSVGGRIFTMAIGLVGIGIVAFIATRSAQVLLTHQRIRERQLSRMIKRMKDHYIVCGFGRIGGRIAQDLHRAGKPFVVIENDDQKIEALEKSNFLHVRGDALHEEVLREAGLAVAKGLILTLPEDGSNVFITLTAREINPALYILVRTERHQNRRTVLRAGADKVISPYEIGADRMAQVILRPNVDRFMEQVLRTGALDLQMDEVSVEPDAPIAGKSLAQSNLRQKYNTIVVGVLNNMKEEMDFNPDPRATIQAGDVLIVLGRQDWIQRLREEGCRAQ